MTRRDDDFPAQNIIPDGRKNAIGVRWWRNFYADILGTIEQAVAAATAANNAQISANTGIGTAQQAQATANNAGQAAAQVQTNLTTHISQAATPTVRGHVLRAETPDFASVASAGLSPAAYDPIQAQNVSNRADDAHARLDDLVAKLQASGAVS